MARTVHQGIVLILFFFGVSFSACNDTKSTSPNEVEREVKAMLNDYHKAIEKDGLLAEFDYLDQSDTFFWVPPGYEKALNYDEVAAVLKSNANNYSTMKFEWDTLTVFPLSNSLATYTGQLTGFFSRNDSVNVVDTVHMLETGNAIKRGKKWWILCGQSRLR